MLSALSLAVAQLGDRRILAVLAKSVAITLCVVAVFGVLGWWGLNSLLAAGGLGDRLLPAGDALRALVSAVIALIAAWLLFRLVAMAVLQFFADEVVIAVEDRHYPAAARAARPLGLRAELANGLRGMWRSLLWNLAALPFALLLVVTGIGPAVVFGVVNAILLGRELDDMVRLRHRDSGDAALAPSPGMSRFGVGAVVAGLLLVPFVNFLAPVIGAAMATHLVHRRADGYGTRP
jgi:uncharacterized protein involved in cysteine biosynthesis